MATKEDEKKKHAAILKVMRVGVPRIIGLELDGLEATVLVPAVDKLAETEPLHERQFFSEVGLTRVEKSTLDFMAGGELKELAGGELHIVVKRVAPAEQATA